MKIGKFEVNKKLFITFVVVVGLTIILLLVRHFVNNRYEKYKLNINSILYKKWYFSIFLGV